MRIRIIFIACIALAGVIFFSCDKQLDLQPKDSLSTDEALSSLSGIKAATVGMYASLRAVGYYGRSLFIYGDLSSPNIYIAKTNSNRYLSTYQKNYAAVDADALAIWTAIYKTIARSNNILNHLDGVAGDATEKNVLKGQALFVRALGYFDLVRLYAKPYNQGNGTQAGVPIVFTADITNNPGRNTVGEVYTQVLKDLADAKTLLASTDRSTPFEANKYAVSALLSRVYLYKGDYVNSIAESTLVAGAGYSITAPADLLNFYTSSGNDEEIFTVKVLAVEATGSDDIGNLYMKPGYGDARVSPDLVNVFDKANDTRYMDFIVPFSSSPAEFQNNKFRGEDGAQGMWSPKVFRLSEIYLNRAEAYAKSTPANPVSAIADLNAIRTQRGLAALSGISGQPLIDSILLERRREFMFEGQFFFDLMRNGLPVVRNYCNQPTQIQTTNCTLIATDPKTILPIPQAEIDANPSIRGQQNEGY